MAARAKAVGERHPDPIGAGWTKYKAEGGRLGYAAWKKRAEEAS